MRANRIHVYIFMRKMLRDVHCCGDAAGVLHFVSRQRSARWLSCFAAHLDSESVKKVTVPSVHIDRGKGVSFSLTLCKSFPNYDLSIKLTFLLLAFLSKSHTPAGQVKWQVGKDRQALCIHTPFRAYVQHTHAHADLSDITHCKPHWVIPSAVIPGLSSYYPCEKCVSFYSKALWLI